MNPRAAAVRSGLSRGLIEYRHLLATPSEVGVTLVTNGLALTFLILAWRNDWTMMVGGEAFPVANLILPGWIGAAVAFAAIGPLYNLATDREDGTLLRAKGLPHGTVGYLTGKVVTSSLETLAGITFVLVPALFILDGLGANGVTGWLLFLLALGLGMVAVIPFGVIAGCLVRGSRGAFLGGMLVIAGIISISGIYPPLAAWPEWVQWVAQCFPVYWLVLGMRAAFLPDSFLMLEIGGSWRILEMAGVLGAWAVAGLLIAPAVVRRMARRESGANVEANRQKALQRY